MKDRITIPWFHFFANASLRFLFRLFLDVGLKGLENIVPSGPVIAVMNHTSFLDSVLVAAYLRPDVIPMAKAEVFWFPLSAVFYGYGAFPVRRGQADLNALRRSLQVLREGHVLLIAPEGHRSESGTLAAGHEGIALIALKSGAEMLPIGIWGAKKFWSNLARLRRTPVGIHIGEPLVLSVVDAKTGRQPLRAITDEVMYNIARLLPPQYRGTYSEVERDKPAYVMPKSRPPQAGPVAGEEVKQMPT